jgi:hypothetical protein
MAKVRNSPPSGNAKNEAMQAWNMQFPTSAGGTFGGIKIPPQGNPNAAIDTRTLRGIHGEIKNLNKGIALSFEGLSQGIQSLVELQEKSIIADKKEDSDEARALAEGKVKDIEEERESRLKKMGGSLKEGAGAVIQGVQKAASGFSIGGFLTTLIGGALLGAIFAPEKFDKAVKAITGAVTDVVNNEFLQKIAKGLIGSLDWDNLFVTGIFGWRVGAIYSGFKYLGTALADAIGLKETGDDTGSEQTLGSKVKGYLRDGIIGAFGALGIVGALFPALIFKGIGAMGRGLGAIFRTSAGIDAKGGAELPAKYQTAAQTEGLAVQKSFMSKLMGTVKGKGGLIGMAVLAAAAITGAIIYTGLDEDAKNKVGESLKLMEGAALGVLGSASEYAMMGAMLGSVVPVVGTVLGGVLGGLVGAVIGFLSLSDADKENFTKGLSNLWDTITAAFSRGIADIIQSMPDWAIPDSLLEWANKHATTTKSKMSGSEKAIALQSERIDEGVDSLQEGLTARGNPGLTQEQIQQIKNIEATSRNDVEKQIKAIAKGALKGTPQGLNPIIGAIVGRNLARETLRLLQGDTAEALMGDTGAPAIMTTAGMVGKNEFTGIFGANNRKPSILPSADPEFAAKKLAAEIAAVSSEIEEKQKGVTRLEKSDKVMIDRRIGEMGMTGADPDKIAKLNITGNYEKEIERGNAKIAALQEKLKQLNIKKSQISSSVIKTPSSDEETATLVKKASAGQDSAAMNVIMMNNGGGPQSAAAASGTTVNNNTVKSDSNISLYSMNEENRAAYAHLTRFGALG